MHNISDIHFISFICILFSYFLGSIPFGYIFFRIHKKDDIRKYGSGNIGATNVNRLIGKKFAALTLFLDTFKSLLCCCSASVILGREIAIISGFFCIFGHIYPIWLKFNGGKGIAIYLGIFCILLI